MSQSSSPCLFPIPEDTSSSSELNNNVALCHSIMSDPEMLVSSLSLKEQMRNLRHIRAKSRHDHGSSSHKSRKHAAKELILKPQKRSSSHLKQLDLYQIPPYRPKSAKSNGLFDSMSELSNPLSNYSSQTYDALPNSNVDLSGNIFAADVNKSRESIELSNPFLLGA